MFGNANDTTCQIDRGMFRQGEDQRARRRNHGPVRTERVHCADVLFQASFSAKEASGIHDTSFLGLTKHDAGIRKNLYANVLLSCGTSMFHEILERMTKELTASAPFTMKSKVVTPSELHGWLHRRRWSWVSVLPHDVSHEFHALKPWLVRLRESDRAFLS